jgi:hypothetical protein
MARVHPTLDLPGARSTPRRRRWLWPTALLVLATGCASVPSNTPEAYTDTNADGTVIVEANYLSACEESGETSSNCQCYYDAIVETIPFDEFKDFEQQVEDDPADIPGDYQDIVDDCRAGNTVGPTADADADADSTTTTREPS